MRPALVGPPVAGRATSLRRLIAVAARARRLRHAAHQRRQDRHAGAAAQPRQPAGQDREGLVARAEQTGVRLLPLGAYSLDTRIQLAQRATTSLDVQYYVLENDPTGRLLMTALRDASARGVRVRLLVDDLYTTHSDPLLRGLASFPNIEVRLFNPFCCNRSGGVGGRYTASIFDFGRLNHRMHNKLFIADGVMAVAGGRNIADEYFLRSRDANFIDMDAFVMGAVVQSMSAIFDRYWNSEVVYPIEAVGRAARRQGRRAPRRSTRLIASLPPSPPIDLPATDLLGYGPLVEELDSGQLGLRVGHRPRLRRPAREAARDDAEIAFEMSVTNDVMMQVWQAKSDLVLTSPYMIPGEPGMRVVPQPREGQGQGHGDHQLARRDRRAAGPQRLFALPRRAMLKAGVDLYELSPTRDPADQAPRHVRHVARPAPRQDGGDRQEDHLHRLDEPRPALGEHQHRVRHVHRQPRRWRRSCCASSTSASSKAPIGCASIPKTRKLQWLTLEDDKEVILGVEPESSFWLRVHNMLLGWFVPEKLL